MSRYRLFLALVLLLAVNAVVLAGVAANRRGAPDAAIEMTERELPLAWSWRTDENSGVALSLNWHQHDADWAWFDRQKLAELGVDIRLLEDPEYTSRYYRSLPVKAFAALEYAGPAWQAYKAKIEAERDGLDGQVAAGEMKEDAAARRRKEIAVELRVASRLFAIDVDSEPEVLRARYPDSDRFIIAPAEVRAIHDWTAARDGERPQHYIFGRIERVLTDTIHLPRQFHALMEQLPDRERLYANRGYYNADDALRPHYRVRIAFGQRYEPWVTGIVLMEAEELD